MAHCFLARTPENRRLEPTLGEAACQQVVAGAADEWCLFFSGLLVLLFRKKHFTLPSLLIHPALSLCPEWWVGKRAAGGLTPLACASHPAHSQWPSGHPTWGQPHLGALKFLLPEILLGPWPWAELLQAPWLMESCVDRMG